MHYTVFRKGNELYNPCSRHINGRELKIMSVPLLITEISSAHQQRTSTAYRRHGKDMTTAVDTENVGPLWPTEDTILVMILHSPIALFSPVWTLARIIQSGISNINIDLISLRTLKQGFHK
jgi:hypothetical protein